MKGNLLKLFSTFILFALVLQATAQQNLRERIRTTQGVSQHFTRLAAPEQIAFNAKQARQIFNLDPNSDLVLQNTHSDKLGFIHYRYYQTYKGFPVENSMYIVHTKSGKLTGMSGSVVTDFNLQTAARLSVNISAQQAINLALKAMLAQKYAWQDAKMEEQLKLITDDKKATYYPKPEKVWFNAGEEINPSQLRLCYKIDVYSIEPTDRKYIFIDVQRGKVLGTKQILEQINTPGTANTAYSGTQNIISDYIGNSYYVLRDYSKGKGIVTLDKTKSSDYYNNSANWNLTGADQYALDAHYGVSQTWSFYNTIFNRNSIDNNGYQLTSWVNDPNRANNAIWDGTSMHFGTHNGAGVTSIDVAGHEITHGVTQYTSKLNYSYESGAIDESMSDIMGKAIQFWSKPDDINWKLGNDMNWLLRDMSNPNAYGQPDTYKGIYWATSFLDNGGVHTNSGVGNFMFYLLVNGGSGRNDNDDAYTVSGIGLSKAEQIIYRTETVYLTPTSQYADWRQACINAATDLYGANSNEAIQVANAWHAVGVGIEGGNGCGTTPTGLTALNITETSATISWNAVPAANSFNLQYQPAGGSWIKGSAADTFYNLTNLTVGTTYNFQIQTVCASGITSPYAAFSFSTIANDIKSAVGGSGDDYAGSIVQTSDKGYAIAGWSNSTDGNVSGNHGSNDYWLIKTDSAEIIQWTKSLGGSGDDDAQSIQQTPDGGYIIAGYSNSNDGDVSGNHGSYDYWIVKTDNSGNIQWQKSLGGSGFDFATNIQQTADGGYVIAGISNSNDGDVSGNHGNNDYWIVKLDGSGNLQWQKSFGGSGDDIAQSIRQTTDGGYVVAGYSNSNDGDVSGNHNDNYNDYWVIKLDGSGNMQWQKTLGGYADDKAYSIQQTGDGGYIVAGESASGNGDVTGNHGNNDYWIVKLDGSGNLQWQKSFGGSGDDEAYSILQTKDGGYAVAGYANSTDGDVSGNHGNSDYWVIKLDEAGNLMESKCLGGSGSDAAYQLQQTSDSEYIVAGYSNSNDGDVHGNRGGFDYWITKVQLNSLGNIAVAAGGSADDEAQSIQQTKDKGYIVAGYSNSNDGNVYGNHGNHDYWIIKTDSSENIQWEESLGGSGDDYAKSIQQTTDSGFIIAGYSNSNDGNVSGNHGDNDYWIVKTDSLGNIQWQKSLGGSSDDEAQSIQQTSDGGYIVAGYSLSNDGDVSGNHGGYDFWIVKLDASGNIQWQKSLGGSGLYDLAFSIKQTTDGGYVVAGWSNSNDGDVTGNHGNTDDWIVKLDASGNIQWQKSLGGSNNDGAQSILQTADGGYIVAGPSNSNNGDVTGNHGSEDYWIVKLNSSGDTLWQKSFGGSGDDAAWNIQPAADGGYVVTGASNTSNDGDVTGNHGSYDYWIIKLSALGNLEDEKSLGGSGEDYGQSLTQINDSDYIVAGYSNSNDGDVSSNHGGYDVWITKVTLNNCPDADGDGYTVCDGDCDDHNPKVHPGAREICGNGIDDNCNGQIDEGCETCTNATNLTTTNITSNSATLNWQSSADPLQWRVAYKKQGDQAWTIINLSGSSRSVNISSLDANYIYWWRIRAKCKKQLWTAFSPNARFKTTSSQQVAELSETLQNSLAEKAFKLYPNPSNGRFIIQLYLSNNINANAKIELINITGQTVYTESASVIKGSLQKTIILPSSLAQGIYIVRIIANNEVHQTKLVYEK